MRRNRGARGAIAPTDFKKLILAPTVWVKLKELLLVICMDGNAKMHAKLLLLREKSKNGLVFYWLQAPLIFVE